MSEGELQAVEEYQAIVAELQGHARAADWRGAVEGCGRGMGALSRFLAGAEKEVDDALQQLHRHERLLEQTFVTGIIGLTLLLTLGWVALGLFVVRPVLALKRNARRIGDRRFGVGPMPAAVGELAELEKAFADMAGEIAGFTAELEGRVRERTAALEESRAQLHAMLDRLPDAVGLLGSGGVPVATNDAYLRLFGGGAQPDTRQGAGVTAQGYLRFEGPDGEVLLDVHRYPIEGEVPLVLEHARDMTSAARTEAVLAATQQLAAFGGLSTAVAHEINNPLTAIGACAEGLLERLGEEERGGVQHEYLELIVNEVYRCKRVTDRLLEAFRGESKTFETGSARALAAECLRLTSPLAQQRGVSLAMEHDSGEDSIETDLDAVRQIVLNLLLNAVNACKNGGAIFLRLCALPGQVSIAVSDNGRGIPRDRLPQLFEPSGHQLREPGGSGIGLFICRSLAAALGGQIIVESPGEGLGSTFTLVIPSRPRRTTQSEVMAS